MCVCVYYIHTPFWHRCDLCHYGSTVTVCLFAYMLVPPSAQRLLMDLSPDCSVGIETNTTNSSITSPANSCPGTGDLEIAYLSVQPALSWSCVGTGLLGIVGNSLTLFVYAKLGFQENINTSYATLAVMDLFCSLATIAYGICNTFVVGDILARYQVRANVVYIAGIFGAGPHLAFSKITALLTAWISFERCMCVVFPTRAKAMMTRRVSFSALVASFIAGFAPVVFLYAGLRLDTEINPHDNVTTTLLVDLNPALLGSQVAAALYGLVYPTVSWITVSVCTTVLIVRLRRLTRWRELNATAAHVTGTNPRHMSTREKRLTRTVVGITCVFIVCTLPLTIHGLCIILVRGYSYGGSYRYLFQITSLVCLLMSQVNSTTNFVVFTVLGSRFRQVVVKMFRCRY